MAFKLAVERLNFLSVHHLERIMSPRWIKPLAALCTGLTLSLGAQAGLQIESLYISASALVTPPSGQTSGNTWFWESNLGLAPMVTSAGARSGGLAAAARQTPDGFFLDQAAYTVGWEDPRGPSTMRAGTEFKLTVSTDEADTPLILDFHFLGSLLQGGAHYGAGRMTVGAAMTISAGHGGATLDTVWSFDDRLLLDSVTSSVFVPQSNGADLQGVGLPQLSSSAGWVQFVSRGEAERQPFVGQLDFGLLQPGETFRLQYMADAWIDSDISYAGDAQARLVDPFSLGGTPPLQLHLQGLVLPTAAVPESTSVILMLAGLGVLGWRARRRTG